MEVWKQGVSSPVHQLCSYLLRHQQHLPPFPGQSGKIRFLLGMATFQTRPQGVTPGLSGGLEVHLLLPVLEPFQGNCSAPKGWFGMEYLMEYFMEHLIPGSDRLWKKIFTTWEGKGKFQVLVCWGKCLVGKENTAEETWEYLWPAFVILGFHSCEEWFGELPFFPPLTDTLKRIKQMKVWFCNSRFYRCPFSLVHSDSCLCQLQMLNLPRMFPLGSFLLQKALKFYKFWWRAAVVKLHQGNVLFLSLNTWKAEVGYKNQREVKRETLFS